MDTQLTVQQLSALAQETRLHIYRALVQAGPAGLNPGALLKQLDIGHATLSFHLKELKQATLVHARQEGRFVFYQANYQAMSQLIETLTENCCAGATICCD